MKNKFRQELILRAFQFARKIIKLIENFPNKRSSRIIADQLLKAETTIGANIIEAQAASSKKDFVNFLNHTLKSANETKFWLALSKDISPKILKEIQSLLNENKELANILGSSIKTLKSQL